MTEISIAGSCGELSKPRCYHPPQPSGMASGKVRVRAGRIAAGGTLRPLSTSISSAATFGLAARYVVRSRGEGALWNERDALASMRSSRATCPSSDRSVHDARRLTARLVLGCARRVLVFRPTWAVTCKCAYLGGWSVAVRVLSIN